MTPTETTIFPTLDDIESFKELRSETIYIKSPIMGGMVGLIMESIWRVDYKNESIHFVSANHISKFTKTPLTPFNVPDRHHRSVRKIGAALFKKERFDNLVLFEMTDPSKTHVAIRGEESRLFAERIDAQLWLLQRDEEGEVREQTIKKRSKKRKAQQNSADIRAEMLGLMTQITTGIGAEDRLRTLLDRGLEPRELEKIWRHAHGHDDIPETLRSIIYKDKEKA